MSKFVKPKQLSLALSTGPAQNLKQLNQKLANEFNTNAQLLRSDMDKLFTHFILLEDIVNMGGKLTVDLEKLLTTTEQVAGTQPQGMKELSQGQDRELVVEGGQKSKGKILNAFNKVKRETVKLFDGRFFKGKEFGHQDITPSGIRLAAFAQALQDLEDNLIALKNPTPAGEGRVSVPSQAMTLQKQNIAELRKVKQTVQKMVIATNLIEKMPMTATLKTATAKTKYIELAKVFNSKSTKDTEAILDTQKQKLIDLRKGKARIELKIEAASYNQFKKDFQSPLGTNASRIFKGQKPSGDLTKYFINKVKIGKLTGSESIEDKIVKDVSALAMGKKIKATKTRSKVKTKAGKLSSGKKTNVVNKHAKLTQKAKSVRNKAARATKKGTKGKESATENQDLFKLEKLIQKRLPAEVRRNMGRPALRNQTSTFSNSVQLESLRPTAQGISGEYSYQLSPYETFENTGSRRWPTGYNPKPLIAKSIRNLAMQYTEQKLVSLRRT